MSNKTSDKNVANIEDDVKILKELLRKMRDKRIIQVRETWNDDCGYIEALENILLNYTRQKQINEEHQKLNGELKKAINTAEKEKGEWIEECQQKDERIKALEEENKKLKAQHVFTRNKATDEEKAELFDAIDKTLDTFLEKEKPIWQQEMKTNKMSLVEALNIVDSMYQDRYKIVQENNTIYADRLKDVKFTNLEFASVRLLREVLSLQSKLKNSIPKQTVIDKIKEYYKRMTEDAGHPNWVVTDRIVMNVLQELLEGESK